LSEGWSYTASTLIPVSIAIDITQPLRRPSDLLELVQAVEAALPADEAEWVEWKASLDLSGAEGRFSIARQILGFANRSPERAGRFVGGMGFMLVGVEPGGVAGVTAIDVAKLDDGLRPYLGTDGPIWSATFIMHQGKTVLVVSVEPPQWGQRFYPLRKSYQPPAPGKLVEKGTVFVRGQASTERATDVDLDMLQDRLARGSAAHPELALELSCQTDPPELRAIDAGADAREAWFTSRREELLELRRAQKRSELWPTGISGGSVDGVPLEALHDQEHAAAVEKYIAEVRPVLWRALLTEAFRSGLNTVQLTAVNPTDHNVPGLEIVVELPGAVLAYEPDDDELKHELPPAPRPRPRGVGYETAALLLQSRSARDSLLLSRDLLKMPKPLRLRSVYAVTIENRSHNQATTTLTFHVPNLRPRQSRQLEPFRLILLEPPGTVVAASWSATSTGTAAGVAEGVVRLQVSGEPALTPLDLVPLQLAGEPD
jgi:hypothetical protein